MYNTYRQYTSRTIVINDFAIDCRVSHIGHERRKWRAKSNDQGHDECVYEYNSRTSILLLQYVGTYIDGLRTTIRILVYT